MKKADEFPTKALVKLFDSLYSSPVPKDHGHLHGVLAGRTTDVASLIQEYWKPSRPFNDFNIDDYSKELHAFNFAECGIVGTPLLLSQLNIDLPSGSFMRRCRQRGFHKNPKDDASVQAPDDASRVEYTAAEIRLTVADRSIDECLVRYPENNPS